jgi:GTP-binding protein Era
MNEYSGGEENPGRDVFRSGFVALVGRPNVGKSTLLNAMIGRKLAITSNVAQTTRRRMRAVLNTPSSQLVIVDTPGLHKPKDTLGKELNRAALSSLEDVDVVALLIDATQEVGRGDEWVAQHVRACTAPHKLLVITKADRVSAQQARSHVEAASKLADFDDVLVTSAQEGFNVESFVDLVSSRLPEGPRWFPEDMDCDMSDEELVAEFVREKAFRNLRQELPHSLAVTCDDITWEKNSHAVMTVTLLVERESQKAIVIGRSGTMIKRIGTEARRDIERLFGARVFLDLSVHVQPSWRRDHNEIRRLGLEVDE